MHEELSPRRLHKDILLPHEEKLPASLDLRIDGPFEKNFDLYRYATMVKKVTPQKQRELLKKNPKIIACIALLLKNPELPEHAIRTMFGIGNKVLERILSLASDEGKRKEFVKKFTKDKFLTSPLVQADPEIIRHIEMVASRVAMNTRTLDIDV